jgi:hypothetical protein
MLVQDSKGLFVIVVALTPHTLQVEQAIYMVDGGAVEPEELEFINDKYFQR